MATDDLHSGWAKAWRSPVYRRHFLISLLVLAALPFFFHHFFGFLESRKGVVLDDPILRSIQPVDVSVMVFLFLYGGIVFALLYLLPFPYRLLSALQTYLVATFFRILALLLVPLEPPVGYIPLQEPFVQLFTPGGAIISKDLFFSGHVLTLAVLIFAVKGKWFRTALAVCAFLVALGVLIQHNHYVIDVVFALPAAWLAHRIVSSFSGGAGGSTIS